MNGYLPDIIENFENAAEHRLDEMTEGLPKGKFRCDCGNIDDLDHAAPSGSNPYSAPMCRKCANAAGLKQRLLFLGDRKMDVLELQEQINDYRRALDALIELKSDKYRKAINDLRDDIARLEREYDEG